MTNEQLAALKNHANDLKDSLLDQPATDYVSYRERVGLYRGILEAIEILLSLDKSEDD